MSDKVSISAGLQVPVASTDWAGLLSREDLANLAGFFDVLIEMDFEQNQRNKEGVQSEGNTKNSNEAESFAN